MGRATKALPNRRRNLLKVVKTALRSSFLLSCSSLLAGLWSNSDFPNQVIRGLETIQEYNQDDDTEKQKRAFDYTNTTLNLKTLVFLAEKLKTADRLKLIEEVIENYSSNSEASKCPPNPNAVESLARKLSPVQIQKLAQILLKDSSLDARLILMNEILLEFDFKELIDHITISPNHSGKAIISDEAAKQLIKNLNENQQTQLVEKIMESKNPFNPEGIKALQSLTIEQRKNLVPKIMSDPSQNKGGLLEALEIQDYQTLLGFYDDKELEEVAKSALPSFIRGISLIDWVNMTHFPDPFIQNIYTSSPYQTHFNAFNTMDKLDLYLEPLAHNTSLKFKSPFPRTRNLTTIGGALGGNYLLNEHLVISGALGYSHSHANWKKELPGKKPKTTANTVTISPSLSYLFPNGYLSLKILGGMNFYKNTRYTKLLPDLIREKKHARSEIITWDILGRISGGYSFSLGKNLFLYPYSAFDYGLIFSQKTNETVDENVKIKINSLLNSFFRGVFECKLSREKFREGFGFVIPYITAGFTHQHVSIDNTLRYKLAIEERVLPQEKSMKIKNWNQWSIGTGLSVLYVRGIYASLDYKLSCGKEVTTHTGSIRFDLTW